MLNRILYTIFRTPANVRLAKGAIAAGIAAGCAFLVTALGDLGSGYPPLIIAVATPILLWFEKWAQGWGKPPTV